MPNYQWACVACDHSNAAGTTVCARCSCPSTPTATEVDAHKARFTSTQGRKYQCGKCAHEQFDVGETRNSGGILSSVFEVETEKFSFIACARCGFTEFYRCDRNVLRAIFDLEIG